MPSADWAVLQGGFLAWKEKDRVCRKRQGFLGFYKKKGIFYDGEEW
ncbi:hypothetical protein PM3016_2894 [Paenibacillus mucilaginosus 3016]|uniref:Uncharacterized protein n=2 Tax=Paenibacillus mucilaginosus TaxID=61624 RepID=H6NL59_9BACL|nr:hypothetical protein PM3016_2894 [Paenibacillus mucilaginosus 3016]